jgi:hypothetical protein
MIIDHLLHKSTKIIHYEGYSRVTIVFWPDPEFQVELIYGLVSYSEIILCSKLNTASGIPHSKVGLNSF